MEKDKARIIGVSWMLLSGIMLTANHATIRWISTEIHPFEIAFFRNFLGVLFVIPLLIPGRFAALKTQRLGAHFNRALLNAGFMLTYFLGLSLIPIAEATALGFTGPLASALLASILLKERLTPPRIIGLTLGFAGVLVIIRPGIEVISWGSLLILLSSAFFGMVMVSVRDLARTESSLTITTYVALLLVPITLIPALWVWQWPDLRQFGILSVMALFATLGQLTLSQASKMAETSAIMPVDFTRLIWASLIGVFLFSDSVEIPLIAGASIIFLGAVIATVWGKQAARG